MLDILIRIKKFIMQYFGRAYIGSRGFAFLIPDAKKHQFGFCLYRCSKFSIFAFAHSFMSVFVTALSSVVIILTSRSFSNIVPAIIEFIAVYVIDILFWPASFHDQKCEAVYVISSRRNTNCVVSTKGSGSRYAANFNSVSASFFPTHNPRFRVVRKLRTGKFGRKIVDRSSAVCFDVFSHSTLLRSVWSGAAESICRALLPRICTMEA